MNTRVPDANVVRRALASLSVALMLAGVCAPASAAFFQLQENSVSGLGNAFSGGSASAEDASTVWYNPAGMTRLSGSQLAVAGHFIKPSLEFSKTSANLNPNLSGGPISGGNGGNAGESAFLPNIYFTKQLSEQLYLGFGLNAPFGLATDYDDNWVGRYYADRSEIKTVNFNAALGYKVSQEFSVGGGINYQKIDAKLTQAIDYGSICALAGVGACAAPGANDGHADVTADDATWGFNLGFLWQPLDTTRMGLAYRSKMKYTLKGNSDVTAPSPTAAAVGASAPFNIADAGVKANVTLPATLSLSGLHKLSPEWTLTADVTRTYWSDLPELRIDFDSAQKDSVVTLNLKDVNRYSVGATYAPGGAWTYRAGIALDKSPSTSESERTPRLPDADRTWFAFGANYKSSETMTFDFGYVYIKVDDANINKKDTSLGTDENFLRGSLVGSYKYSVHILSAQANWKF